MTRDALLRHILENPADDAARLVFADWCEEHGEGERAEFIRVQIAAAALIKDQFLVLPESRRGQRHAALVKMAQTLLDRVHQVPYPKAEPTQPGDFHIGLAEAGSFTMQFDSGGFSNNVLWAFGGDLFAWVSIKPIWERGFVSAIETTCAAFHEHAAAVFAAQPVTEVRLTDLEVELDNVLGIAQNAAGLDELVQVTLNAGTLATRYRISGRGFSQLAHGPFPACWYDSYTELQADISTCCVAYGRSLVGLPQLTSPAAAQTPPASSAPPLATAGS